VDHGSRSTKILAAEVLLAGAGALIAVAVVGRDTPPGRALRRGIDRAARRMRYAEGRLQGLGYRLAGRQPDPTVSDDILADRIRSEIGGLEKRLDVPHVHVMVQDHVALLHGEVPTARDAETIERAVREVPGVRDLVSHLHVGLGAGETRPSAGRAERARLFAHVPADVSELVVVPHRTGETARPPRTASELTRPIAAAAHLDPAHADAVTRAVLGHLRRLVPEEAADVEAVLPHELRVLWTAVASTP